MPDSTRLRERVPTRPSLSPSFVLKYYAYRATVAVGFTMPIWYLYLEATTGSYTLAAAANAIWWLGLVVFEIPTGYLGDRLGHRRAILVGATISAASMASMAFVSSFHAVAVLFILWSFGVTFKSGTIDAWLYELLSDRLDSSEFARVRGRGGTVALVVSGTTALAGGYIASSSMANAYLASAAVVALAIPIVWSFPEASAGRTHDAHADSDGTDDTFTVLDAIPVLREQFSQPPLRSFVLLVGLYTGVHWGVNFFIQPVSVDLGFSRAHLGWLFAGFTTLSAVVSWQSGALKERVGARRWFCVVPLVLAVVFVSASVVPLLALPAFFLMRALRSASMPLASQFINDHTGDVGRATVLSAAGMVYNLVTVPFEFSAGVLADVLGPSTTIGLFGATLFVGSVILLAAGSPFASNATDAWNAASSLADD